MRTCMGGKCTLIRPATGILLVGLFILLNVEGFFYYTGDYLHRPHHGPETGISSSQESPETPYTSSDTAATVPLWNSPLRNNSNLAVNHSTGGPSLKVTSTCSSSKALGTGSWTRHGSGRWLEVSNLQAEASSISALLPDLRRTLDCSGLCLTVHGHSLNESLMGAEGASAPARRQVAERATATLDATWQIATPRPPAERQGVAGKRQGTRQGQSTGQGQRRPQAQPSNRSIILAQRPAGTAGPESSAGAQSRCPAATSRGVGGAASSRRALAALCIVWHFAGLSANAVATVPHPVWPNGSKRSPTACQISHRCQAGAQPPGAGKGSLRTGLACLYRPAFRAVLQASTRTGRLPTRSTRSHGSMDAEGQNSLCGTYHSRCGWLPTGGASLAGRCSVGHDCRRGKNRSRRCRCQNHCRGTDQVPYGSLPWCPTTSTGSQCGSRAHTPQAQGWKGRLPDRALRRRSGGQCSRGWSSFLYAAPCLSPAPSLTGLVGLTHARLWQGTGLLHSARNHDDFSTPWLASLRGLLMHLEVIETDNRCYPPIYGGFDDITGQQSSVVLRPLRLHLDDAALAHWYRRAYHHQDDPSLVGMPDGARTYMGNSGPIEPQCKPASAASFLISPQEEIVAEGMYNCTVVQSSASVKSSAPSLARPSDDSLPLVTQGTANAKDTCSPLSRTNIVHKNRAHATQAVSAASAKGTLVKGGSCRPFPVPPISSEIAPVAPLFEEVEPNLAAPCAGAHPSFGSALPSSSSHTLVKGGSRRSFPGLSASPVTSGPTWDHVQKSQVKRISFSYEISFWFPSADQICLSNGLKASRPCSTCNLRGILKGSAHRVALKDPPLGAQDCSVEHVGIRSPAPDANHGLPLELSILQYARRKPQSKQQAFRLGASPYEAPPTHHPGLHRPLSFAGHIRVEAPLTATAEGPFPVLTPPLTQSMDPLSWPAPQTGMQTCTSHMLLQLLTCPALLSHVFCNTNSWIFPGRKSQSRKITAPNG